MFVLRLLATQELLESFCVHAVIDLHCRQEFAETCFRKRVQYCGFCASFTDASCTADRRLTCDFLFGAHRQARMRTTRKA